MSDGESSIRIEASVSPRVNLAFHQNAVRTLRELSIVNEGAEPVTNLVLTLSADPPFILERSWNIDVVRTGETYHLPKTDVTLDDGILARLTEAESSHLTFTLTADGRTLASKHVGVELLARDQWGGVESSPEMVAAFVQPNDPAIERLLKKAAELLRANGKDGALDGYQRGARRAWDLTSAIWGACASLGLDYALPPASFEVNGQKVRSPSRIVEAGLATCLDSTLLFCAAFEQAGLNSVIVFSKNHSYAGVWLVPEEFSTVVVDDVTALRKRAKLNELLLFETTVVSAHPTPPFSYAVKTALEKIEGDGDEAFILAVDVRRARMQRIRPLASAADERTENVAATSDVDTEIVFEDPPGLPEEDQRLPDLDPEKPEGRLERWQRKLLDLSLRNRLLNFRPSKKSLFLDAPDPGRIEDLLADGDELKIMPRPEVMSGGDPRDETIYRERSQEDARRENTLEALGRKQVFVNLPKEDLDARLVNLYRSARLGMQEGGANTLYLALGFLKWTRADNTQSAYKAPLILIPVNLKRTSVRAGFRLSIHDDEPRFNPTLVEMLRQDFGLVLGVAKGELPKDESGLDVAGIWRSVARSIKDLAGWEIVEEVVLATFSFSKYLMWKDLVDRTDELKESAVVQHLIETPNDAYPSTIEFPDAQRLDDLHHPSEVFCPLSADSSQMAAIMAASAGKDFVLIGPPGTGKSQTIANLIAQALAEEKTVLFVSEKIAALDVVYRRLRKMGIADFCLQLHSNKARKREVLDQLNAAWATGEPLEPEDWKRTAERLKEQRDKLNRYVGRLHRRHANGLSAYDAIGGIVAEPDIPIVPLSWPDPEIHSEEDLGRLQDLAARLSINAREAGEVGATPLNIIEQTEWSPSWQHGLVAAARGLIPAAQALEKSATGFLEAVGLTRLNLGSRERHGLLSLARTLPRAAGQKWRFTLRQDARGLAEDLEKGLELLEKYDERLSVLNGVYRSEATKLDLEGLRNTMLQSRAAWWPRSWLQGRPVVRQLKAVARKPKEVDVDVDLDALMQLKEVEEQIEALSYLAPKTDGLWQGLKTERDAVKHALSFRTVISSALGDLARTPDALEMMRAALGRVVGDGNPLLDETGAVGAAAATYLREADAFETALRKFLALASTKDLGTNAEPAQDPATLTEACALIVEMEPKLRAWCAWRKVRDEAVGQGMEPLVKALDNGTVTAETVTKVFDRSYCRWWLDAIVDSDDVLRSFVSAEHEKRIDDFKRIDEQYAKVTSDYIRARLCAEIPVANSVARSSEWGRLKREITKRSRNMPIREMMSQMPTALRNLAPCVLMSPLSTAQYLTANARKFNLVVFDEASQIPIWDAIGAIARGQQVVMVGDPKQLPPTTFFDRASGGALGDDQDSEDLESILDECMGANLPTRSLRWHYRSRNESLITFSNHRYYGSSLITFPSPATDDEAVQFHYVSDGVYARGGARTNIVEARALVKHLLEHLTDPGFALSGKSIGVVTFNADQQGLIEDLLDEARRSDPGLERYFSDDLDEPILVKNLESVQGDERDIMYFSVTYGPDRSGAKSMNFGPINKPGGERRLNVAITRAREALHVFSSLRPEEFDLARTQAIGVRDLKHFLEYAERGPRALAEAVQGSVGSYESPFEQAVGDALQAKGWTVHPQVGASRFRIDLGVVHPDEPGRYLAGIECDGATYHRLATARDRDQLREAVLRNLGWEIIRIWSLDWWQDAVGTLERVCRALENLLEADRKEIREDAADVDESTSAMSNDEGDDGTAVESAGDAEEREAETTDYAPASVTSNEGPQMQMVARRFTPDTDAKSQTEHNETSLREYVTADLSKYAPVIDAGLFYEAEYTDILLEIVNEIVKIEAPLRVRDLARVVARAHGWSRTGSQIRRRIWGLVRNRFPLTKEGVGTFVWPSGWDTSFYPHFREPGRGEARSVRQIAMPELAALARYVMANGFDGDAAIMEMAHHVGLSRLRSDSRTRLETAWSCRQGKGV